MSRFNERVYDVVVLKRKRIFESDGFFVGVARGYGKIMFKGKSVNKMTSKMSGKLVPPCLVRLTLVGGDIGVVKEVVEVDNFEEIKSDFGCAQVLYPVMEVALLSSVENNPHDEVFDVTKSFLSDMARGERSLHVYVDTISKLLGISTDHCVNEKQRVLALEDFLGKKLNSLNYE